MFLKKVPLGLRKFNFKNYAFPSSKCGIRSVRNEVAIVSFKTNISTFIRTRSKACFKGHRFIYNRIGSEKKCHSIFSTTSSVLRSRNNLETFKCFGHQSTIASAADLKANLKVEIDGKLYVVLSTNKTMQGRGSNFITVELRDYLSGKKMYKKFGSGDKVNVIALKTMSYSFLYEDETLAYLMDPESFEQKEISKEIIGDKIIYLQGGEVYDFETFNDEVIGIKLPTTMSVTILEDAMGSGNTRESKLKFVKVSNLKQLRVPSYLKVGDKVLINTTSGEYSGIDERV